jgi:hypothetical protein
MNSDSEALARQLFAWLLQDTASTAAPPTEECDRTDGVENPLEEAAASNSGGEGPGFSPQTFELGEIPAVQDRFQAVLKRRLQIEIQHQPPLFPWETEVSDYPDRVDNRWLELVPAQIWTAQQKNLDLPLTLPETIFRQLLEKCEAIVASALPLGPKLIQAVESFFPNEPQELNHLATLVIGYGEFRDSPPKSGSAAPNEILNFETSYSDLLPRQQMALSLLAAKQLLSNLTMTVSPTHPVVERQWLTSAGLLNLQVEYQLQGKVPRLRVEGELPAKGVLKLRGDQGEAIAQSSSPGELSVELSNLQPNQTYALEVHFPEIDPQPLVFAVCATH